MDADFDTKYGHLTKPLKEAAMCWDIDLHSVIESFLHHESDENSSHDPNQMMNFAQAGMLVSSTTTNYSRKVEHLYSLVYTTLDSLSKGEGKSLASSAIMKKFRKRLVGFQEFEAGFELLDAQFKDPAKGIDLPPEDDVDPAHNVHVIRRVPLLLLPREEADNKKEKQNGTEYKSSNCWISKTGCLLLDPSFVALETSDNISAGGRGSMGGRGSAHGPLIPGAAATVADNDAPVPGSPPLPELSLDLAVEAIADLPALDQASLEEFDAEDHMADLDMGEISSLPPVQLSPTRQYPSLPFELQTPAHRSGKKQRVESPKVDRWQELDPHSSGQGGRNITLKVGRCSEPPPDLLSFAEVRDSLSTVNAYQSRLDLFKSKEETFGTCLSFFQQELGVKLRELRRKAALTARLAKQADESSDEEDQGYHGGRYSIANSHEGGGGRFSIASSGRRNSTAMLPASGSGPLSFVPVRTKEEKNTQMERERTAMLEKVLESTKRDYDEFMRKHMQSHQGGDEGGVIAAASSSAADKIPELYLTIRKWQDNLEPLLEEQNAHPAFDLDDYLVSIIDKLKVEGETGGDVAISEFLKNAGLDDFSDNEDEEILTGSSSFDDLVKGQPKWNVCRLFLSTLILTNNGNIDIVGATSDVSSPRRGGGSQTMGAGQSFQVKLKNADKNLKLAVEDNSVGIVVTHNLPKPEPIGDVPFAED